MILGQCFHVVFKEGLEPGSQLIDAAATTGNAGAADPVRKNGKKQVLESQILVAPTHRLVSRQIQCSL